MAMPGSSKMLRSFHKRPEYLQALDRVKEWTRSRFRLPEDAAILVTEVACAARLSAARDRGRVLDRRRHAPSLQGVQAGRGGRPR